MALCPFAEHRLLPENKTQGRISPRSVILHSAVDGRASSLFNFFANPKQGLESHFYVRGDGHIEQYMDTQVRADANNKANAFAVSIETDDNGNPDAQPWSDQQVVALVKLVSWICDVHDIPKAQCAGWDKPGVGWHSMWGAPSPWTPARGKTCPGKARIEQIKTRILPALGVVPVTPPPPAISAEVDFLKAIAAAAAAKPVLKKGNKGVKVKDFQTVFNKAVGFPALKVDGNFGATTEKWVKQYQSDRGLPADGVVGQRTWAFLLAECFK